MLEQCWLLAADTHEISISIKNYKFVDDTGVSHKVSRFRIRDNSTGNTCTLKSDKSNGVRVLSCNRNFGIEAVEDIFSKIKLNHWKKV